MYTYLISSDAALYLAQNGGRAVVLNEYPPVGTPPTLAVGQEHQVRKVDGWSDDITLTRLPDDSTADQIEES